MIHTGSVLAKKCFTNDHEAFNHTLRRQEVWKLLALLDILDPKRFNFIWKSGSPTHLLQEHTSRNWANYLVILYLVRFGISVSVVEQGVDFLSSVTQICGNEFFSWNMQAFATRPRFCIFCRSWKLGETWPLLFHSVYFLIYFLSISWS